MYRLEQIRAQREAILRLAANYGIRRVRLFGSVGRGEAGRERDVDVLVDFGPGRSSLDKGCFEQDLEALLGCEVDVISAGGISPYLEDRILKEALPLCPHKEEES